MKTLLALTVLLTSVSAFASDTTCSDATGTVQYLHKGYNRGIPPRDGDEIGRIQIKIRGKLVSESIAYQNKEPVLGQINPDFSEIKVLREQSGRFGYVKDFAAKLALTPNKKNPGPFDMASEYFVVCQESFYPVP